MSMSYKKLWKILIDRELKKKDLIKLSGISTASMAKLGRNENITTEILAKICNALKVDIGDIMEVLPKESGENYEKQKTSNKK
ncbi:helix-turn-helix domain-containing protein [Clostridium sp. UBA1652]|uniref:helix-turn-helix domain-containing protein n=1 Tax=Clostridium sp. UBA1652 TaxID=1946348 RepID=UPI002580E96A|nr:helix-turn-helix transcriptional regulator [Clostridium sp. UBA1652]